MAAGGVAVGVEHVELAVAVEIDQLDVRWSPRPGRAV